MKNRAKCKLCNTFIESFHSTDYVKCKCGEIGVGGGNAMYVTAGDFGNFIRIDDEGNEFTPKVANIRLDTNILQSEDDTKLSRKDLIDMLKMMGDNIEKLPQQALLAPISHSDFWSLIMLLHEILKSKK